MSVAIRDPNQTAEAIIGRDYLSYSAVNTYRQCPLRFYFRYVQQLPEEVVSSSLVFGGAIHAAAEYHFNELMAGNPAPDLDTLLAVYQEAWRDREREQIRYGKNETIDTLGALAERVLTTFQASEFARPDGRVLGIEEELRGRISDETPELLARVDLIVESDDELVVTDLKTARSRWSDSQVDSSADQLLLYSELVKHLAPDKPLRLQFAVVTKAKTPILTCHDVATDSHRVNRIKRTFERVWQSIEAGSFYPAPSPMNCSTCPFQGPCRAWQG